VVDHHRVVSNSVNPLIPVKISLLTFLAFSGSLFGFSAASIAGPKDNYGDACEYLYQSPEQLWKISCVTKSGRVLDITSRDGTKLIGYLGKGYVRSEKIGFSTVRFEQVNKGKALAGYFCRSDALGACTSIKFKFKHNLVNTEKLSKM